MPTPDFENPILRLADLPQTRPTRFVLSPNAEQMRQIAEELGLSGLRKLRLAGDIAPGGKADWHIRAEFGATVVQPCVVTLAPVSTRIDTRVERRYLADWTEPDGAEAEMPEDDSVEALPVEIDLSALMVEELALNIPDYPRSAEAGTGDTTVTEPGKKPLTDEDVKPFAGLAALRDKLTNED